MAIPFPGDEAAATRRNSRGEGAARSPGPPGCDAQHARIHVGQLIGAWLRVANRDRSRPAAPVAESTDPTMTLPYRQLL
jgi:hypothetical protein